MSVLSLADLKEDLQITDNASDSLLQRLLDSAEAEIAKEIGTVFVPESDELPTFTEKHPFEKIFNPKKAPIDTVVSLTVDGETLSDTMYEVYDCSVHIFADYSSKSVLEITYKAGYQGIPDGIRELVFLTVNWYLQLKTSPKPQTVLDTRLPDFIKDKLDLYRCMAI